MVSRATTAAARALVTRPWADRPGAGSSWSRTWTTTARKPATVTVGHHQRRSDWAAWRGVGPWSTSGAHPGRGGWAQPVGGWSQPMRGFTSMLLHDGGGWRWAARPSTGRVRDRAATPGPAGWATWSGRPAPAAEGQDGFAVVGGGGAVGAGLSAAVQGDPAGHAGHGPGAVAQVDQPDGTSHGGAPSKTISGWVRAGRSGPRPGRRSARGRSGGGRRGCAGGSGGPRWPSG